MTIAAKLKRFLDAHKMSYQQLSHLRTSSLAQAAQILQIPSAQCAKTIGIGDKRGIVIAVLPLNLTLNLTRLNALLNRHFSLLPHLVLDKLFYDCDPGAHPSIGEPYGLTTIIDKSFQQVKHIYFATGSSSCVLKMKQEDFCFLTANQKWRSIALAQQDEQRASLFSGSLFTS